MKDYPRLKKLGVKVNLEPVAHVSTDELNTALDKAGIEKERFDELFGVQTAPLVDGKLALYPWDVEDTLALLMDGKKQGTQLFWD